jgi:hypothetical protein
MKYDKIIQDQRWITLCKTAYEKVISDRVITDEEWLFLEDLHRTMFCEIEANRDKLLTDIKQIAYTKVKIK